MRALENVVFRYLNRQVRRLGAEFADAAARHWAALQEVFGAALGG